VSDLVLAVHVRREACRTVHLFRQDESLMYLVLITTSCWSKGLGLYTQYERAQDAIEPPLVTRSPGRLWRASRKDFVLI
jgi:hypothetical protein